jgi:Fuc2NAc and GlcNAc transferase
MKFFLIILAAATLSFLLSGFVRKNAVAWGLVDIPNHRSSHTIPVPRGGGIAMAYVFVAFLPLVQLTHDGSSGLFLALYGASIAIALLGFFDDRGHIPAGRRLIIHFLAALWILYHYHAMTSSSWYPNDLVSLLTAIGLLFLLVWMLNLYNFMDGIDAITGSQTLSVCLPAAYLSWLIIPQDPSWAILVLLASTVAGFLVWNLPPARLFMGDSGSAFLGIVLGCLVIQSLHYSYPLFIAWLILLGVYLVDTSLTLGRRILAGKRFYQAHRSHAYQHAARRLNSHGKVSLGIALINLFWLSPIAYFVALNSISPVYGLCIAFTPLILTTFYFDAGKSETKE